VVGVSDGVLYTGVGRQIEWYYLNPFILVFESVSTQPQREEAPRGDNDNIFMPEGEYRPAMAGGLRDVYGFGLFPASYLVRQCLDDVEYTRDRLQRLLGRLYVSGHW
jgi:hypothetical protein